MQMTQWKKIWKKSCLSTSSYEKYGSTVVFIQKYIYGIKTLIPLAMGGLTKYSFQKFTVYNALAAVVWAVVVGMASYMMGEIILTYAEEYKYYGVAAILAIVFSVSYYFRKI